VKRPFCHNRAIESLETGDEKMNNVRKATVLAIIALMLLVLGLPGLASAQEPTSRAASATASCPPSFEFGCTISGTGAVGLGVNNTSTANNATGVYATLRAPGISSAAVWGRVLGSSSARGYGVYGSHQGSGIGVYGHSTSGTGFLGLTYSTREASGVLGLHAASTGTGAGARGETSSGDYEASGVLGLASVGTPVSDTVGVRGHNNSSTDRGFGVWGTHAGGGAGVYGHSAAGVGVRGHTNAGGDGGYGVLGVVNQGGGWGATAGVRGINNSTNEFSYGIWGSHTNGIGVYGTSAHSPGVEGSSGGAAGVSGRSVSSAGVNGQSGTGQGVYGFSQGNVGVLGTSSISHGVEGVSYTPAKSGVYGHTDENAAIGVWGAHTDIRDQAGTGVLGQGPTGVRGESDRWGGFGVSGSANDGTGVAGYSQFGKAIYGHSQNSYAGYFEGNVHVIGAFSVAVGPKNFVIDHPLDPANQYLYHASIESDEMMNQYAGTIVLDEQGEATVELAVWFEALNSNFRYHLTPIGAPGPNLYIAEEIQGNQFRIAGGTPGMKVSWLVITTRSDPYAADNPLRVEVPKPENERGTYLYPAGYGQPESRSVTAAQQEAREVHLGEAPAPTSGPAEPPAPDAAPAQPETAVPQVPADTSAPETRVPEGVPSSNR
jgi:hypothetical protein